MKPTLFNIELNTYKEKEKNIAELTIDGIIGEDMFAMDEGNTKEQMRAQLKEIDSIQADKIVVNISSLGGDVDHGLSIHDLLASNSAEVETNVIGMTASAATIIAQAGDVRKMSDNALYLVHRAWTMAMGNTNDFEAMSKDLAKLDDRISNIYAKRSNRTKEEFLELMNESNGDGIWISAEEAQEFGLIDEVSEPMKAAAMDMTVFNKYNLPKPPQAEVEETEDGKVLTYKLNIDLHVNGEPYNGNLEDLKNEFNGIQENPEPKEAEEASASATSRERLKLQIETRKLKHVNYE